MLAINIYLYFRYIIIPVLIREYMGQAKPDIPECFFQIQSNLMGKTIADLDSEASFENQIWSK